MEKYPECIEYLAGPCAFEMDSGNFGPFAQWMFDIGLVFDIKFDKEEQTEPLSWKSFDGKILQALDVLPGEIQLPPKPDKIRPSLNSTLWTFSKCVSQAKKRQPGHRTIRLVPATTLSVRDWSVDRLMTEYSVANPISGLDDAPVPRQLIIIGVL